MWPRGEDTGAALTFATIRDRLTDIDIWIPTEAKSDVDASGRDGDFGNGRRAFFAACPLASSLTRRAFYGNAEHGAPDVDRREGAAAVTGRRETVRGHRRGPARDSVSRRAASVGWRSPVPPTRVLSG